MHVLAWLSLGALIVALAACGFAAGPTTPPATIYIATGATITALAGDTGHVIWQAHMTGTPDALLADAGGIYATVIAGTATAPSQGYSEALNRKDGSVRWHTAPGTLFVPLGSANGVLATLAVALPLVTSTTSTLEGLDAQTGKVRWSRTLTNVAAGPLMVQQTVVALTLTNGAQGTLQAFDSVTGAPRWHADVPPVALLAGATTLDYLTPPYATPPNTLVALNDATGQPQWQHAFTGDSSITLAAATAGQVFAAVSKAGGSPGTLVALDATTGHQQWQATAGPAPIAAVSIGPGDLYCTVPPANSTVPANLVALQTGSGKQIWQTTTAFGAFVPVIAGAAALYTAENPTDVTEASIVEARRPNDGQLIWQWRAPTGGGALLAASGL